MNLKRVIPASKQGRIVLMVALMTTLTVGTVIAANAYVPQTINHYANAYQTSFVGVNAFQGASAAEYPAFSTSSTCTAGPVALGSTLSPIFLSVRGAGGSCASGDFAEVFSILTNTTASGSLSTPHALNFSFQITYGSPATTSFVSVAITTGSSTSANAPQLFYIDLGVTWLPAGGVSGFNTIVSQSH